MAKVYNSEEGYDIYADHYDASLAFLDGFERDRLLAMMGDVSGKRVLDVGCGTGRMIENLKKFGAKTVGLDVSKEMLRVARKKFLSTELVLGEVENLPFEDLTFDMVIATFVIVHLADLRLAFEEVYRVLKDDGIFILTNINQRKAPKLKIGKDEIVIKSFYHRPEIVLQELKDCFFEIEKEEFIDQEGTWINQIVKVRKG